MTEPFRPDYGIEPRRLPEAGLKVQATGLRCDVCGARSSRTWRLRDGRIACDACWAAHGAPRSR